MRNGSQQNVNLPITNDPAIADRHQSTPQVLPRGKRQVSASDPAKVERIVEQSPRKSTGPRTPQGKQRSKLNALKHGLLSKVILLDGESQAEYASLLNALMDDWQPQGRTETFLVENLAVVMWR